MKTIVAALDFSPVSGQVCRTVIELARSLRARVVLLHCVDVRMMPDEYGLMVESIALISAASEKAARRNLVRYQRQFQAASIPAEIVCERGPAATLILEQATRRQAAWIALGSHGHSAVFDLFVGSTAHRVLAKAGCPVIVVPAAGAVVAKDKKCTPPGKRRGAGQVGRR